MNDYDLKSMVGRSFPSKKVCCWVVTKVSGTIEGRSRLVSGNLRHETTVWTKDLVAMFQELDAEFPHHKSNLKIIDGNAGS